MTNQAPEIFVYDRNRVNCTGVVKNLIEYTEDIRFNACSEVSFKIPQKIYDIDTEEWIYNPVYDSLEEDRLLFLCDETEYFRYPIRKPGGRSFYKRNLVTDSSLARDIKSNRLDMNKYLSNFSVHPETLLMDVGKDSGYTFKQFALTEPPYMYPASHTGDWQDYSVRLNNFSTIPDAANYKQYIGCKEFIPVSAGDVVVVNNWVGNGLYINSSGEAVSGSAYRGWTWHVVCYTDADVSTYVGEIMGNESNDVYGNDYGARANGAMRIDISEKLPDGGYIKVWTDCKTYNSAFFKYTDTTTSNSNGGTTTTRSWTTNYIYPTHGAIQIFSGERHCKYIRLEKSGTSVWNNSQSRWDTDATTDGYVYPKMHWFTITATSETDDGQNRTKTVTAYSYEYTLKNKTISLEEDTLPLYTPPIIYDLINGLDDTISMKWLKDCYMEGSFISGPVMSQHTPKGLLNFILEEHPGWQLGHISQELMTTYRKVEAVDDVDLYSFLMTSIQDLYHCFIVFDNDARTISAYTLKDLLHSWKTMDERAIKLTWDNSIQELTKENKATSSFTALRIHTNDDAYGFGLVNPAGNTILYNFTPITSTDELDFIPEGSTNNRTLQAAVRSWQSNYNSQFSYLLTQYNNYLSNNQSVSGLGIVAFIEAHMRYVKSISAKATALANYRSVADKINVYLYNDYSEGSLMPLYALGDKPLTPTEVLHRQAAFCHTSALKTELLAASKAYKAASDEHTSAYDDLYGENGQYNQLRNLCKIYTLDPNQDVSNAYLNPAERLALLDYIKEGSWTDENAVFSDTYGSEDIFTTLMNVYDEAWGDLSTRLNKTQYDFTIDIANIGAIPEFERFASIMYLGMPVYMDIGEKESAEPILLERHINYNDKTDFSYTFTTDMKRRPMQFRFSDLYGTITQTSVVDSAFTFDE